MSERKHVEGFGSIYRKSFKRKRADGTEYEYTSPNWTVVYFHHGEELREQVDSGEERDALKLLKKRVQDLGRGIVGTKEERVTFEQLTEDLKNDYGVNGKRSLDSVELSIPTWRKSSAEIKPALSRPTESGPTLPSARPKAPRTVRSTVSCPP